MWFVTDWFSVGDHILTLEVSNGGFSSRDDMVLTVEAPPGNIRIDHVKITDVWGNPTWVFGKSDSLVMTMQYTLTQALTAKYKVIQKIKAFGKTIEEVTRRIPSGTYTYTNTILPEVPSDALSGRTYSVVFSVEMKRDRSRDASIVTDSVNRCVIVRY